MALNYQSLHPGRKMTPIVLGGLGTQPGSPIGLLLTLTQAYGAPPEEQPPIGDDEWFDRLWVGQGGDVVLYSPSGENVVIRSVPFGSMLSIPARGVVWQGTFANSLVAIRD